MVPILTHTQRPPTTPLSYPAGASTCTACALGSYETSTGTSKWVFDNCSCSPLRVDLNGYVCEREERRELVKKRWARGGVTLVHFLGKTVVS